MKLNYSNILTIEDLQSLSEEEYNQIKLIGQAFKKRKKEKEFRKYKKGLYGKNCTSFMSNALEAFEFAFKNKDFENQSDFKKTLINAEVLFPNNENLIRILLSKNITHKKLMKIIEKISLIKEKIKNNDQTLDESTTLTIKNLNIICALVNKYYPCENCNLIIAKLTEIVLFEKELYLSLEGGTQKTR